MKELEINDVRQAISLGASGCFYAVACEGGYKLIYSKVCDLSHKPNENYDAIIVTATKKVRVFKTLEAVKRSIKKMGGLGSFMVA